MTKVCPVCGRGFVANPSGGGRPQRWCSPRCRNIYHCRAHDTRQRGGAVGPDGRVPIAARACPICGKIFTPKKSSGKYCSGTCRDAAYKRRLRAKLFAVRKDIVCPICGNTFTPKNSRGVYCSRNCLAKAVRLRNRKAPPASRACECCGKEFTPKNSRARFCSKSCMERAWRERHHSKVEKLRVEKLKSPKPSTFQPSTFQPSAERRVREYLSLPDAERYQRRGTLSQAELKMAEKMWNQMHGLRTV